MYWAHDCPGKVQQAARRYGLKGRHLTFHHVESHRSLEYQVLLRNESKTPFQAPRMPAVGSGANLIKPMQRLNDAVKAHTNAFLPAMAQSVIKGEKQRLEDP